METTKPKLWTEKGLKELGRLIKQSREAKGWSLRDLEEHLRTHIGYVSNSTLSGLERANHEPKWNTLAIIAAAQFCLKADGTPYTVDEFSDIASECYQEKNAIFQKIELIHRPSATLYQEIQDVQEEMDFWNERMCLRVQALIKESLKKQGLSRQPGTAAEQAGVDPNSFDRAALRAMSSGSVDRMTGTRVTPGLLDAIAAICYEVLGWNPDHTPRSLGDRTYKDRSQQLLNDLLNHEHQRVNQL